MGLTAGIIARRLWFKFGRQSYAAPNIYVFAFESDFLLLRKSGLITEYEIKLTKADFLADTKKKARIKTGTHKWATMNRYEYLESGLGPNRFYYVIPEELLPEIALPNWAGLITCRPWGNGSCSLYQRKNAKLLHSKNLMTKRDKILMSTYYRYWQNFSDKDINTNMKRTK